MWRPWGKSTARIHTTSSSSSPSSSPFSCSSFKDIQTLYLDELPQQPLPSPTPRKPVFHRVRLANSLIRTWSTHLHNQPLKLSRSLSHPVPETSLPEPQPEPNPSKNVTHAPLKSSPPPSLPEPNPSKNVTHAPLKSSPPPSLPEPNPSSNVTHAPLKSSPPPIYFSGTEQRVVIYFTSLRVVRPIFEDCKSALAILRAFRVQLDERDVAMDSSFLTELNRVMGRTGLTLPRVFIDGRYVGGGEEIRTMHEIGELKKILEGLPVVDSNKCHVCAGDRFVVCNVCNGSRKVYSDKVGFKVCSVCVMRMGFLGVLHVLLIILIVKL